MIADWAHKWVPDIPVSPYLAPQWTLPTYPNPTAWNTEQLMSFMEIIRLVKEMEDKLGGYPCEDVSKLDFLKAIEKRLSAVNNQLPKEI